MSLSFSEWGSNGPFHHGLHVLHVGDGGVASSEGPAPEHQKHTDRSQQHGHQHPEPQMSHTKNWRNKQKRKDIFNMLQYDVALLGCINVGLQFTRSEGEITAEYIFYFLESMTCRRVLLDKEFRPTVIIGTVVGLTPCHYAFSHSCRYADGMFLI